MLKKIPYTYAFQKSPTTYAFKKKPQPMLQKKKKSPYTIFQKNPTPMLSKKKNHLHLCFQNPYHPMLFLIYIQPICSFKYINTVFQIIQPPILLKYINLCISCLSINEHESNYLTPYNLRRQIMLQKTSAALNYIFCRNFCYELAYKLFFYVELSQGLFFAEICMIGLLNYIFFCRNSPLIS